MGALVWKVMSLGSKILGRSVTAKLAHTVWVRSTGRKPPANPMSPGASWPEAVAWSMVTGALSGLTAMVLTRQAAKFYRTSAGHLPKGVDEPTS